MTSRDDRLTRAEEILFEVSELPESERGAAVARLCRADAALEREVTSLLEHARRMGDFLGQPALGPNFSLLPAIADTSVGDLDGPDEMVGSTVGRYRIERRIASGGMGTVYLAARADAQFAQRVALKIVKRGMDTDEILQRFRRERQTLAALEHPNIARLIDGGTTERGQPFLVMEFVEGEAIDAYCDRRELTVESRLRLFLTVCDAVRYAHQNLVVHRDLKPGNILVTSAGQPKLLDFGIATVLDASHTPRATGARERRLTPEYASPEQIAGGGAATTSDVYSLGVILYELLTGRPPYDLTTRTPADIQHAVVDTQPVAPSVAVRREREVRERAQARGCTAGLLARRLRGDLDTIVLAALRKEPERRYPSVEQLATDVRRHLEHQPVSARRDTFDYRAGKFVQRHALATTLAALSIALLVAGVAAFAWQARVAERERDQAILARTQSDAINRFLQNMLASVDPSRSGRNVSVHDVLDDAAQRLQSELGDQPLVRSALHATIGSTYLALGMYGEAEPQLRDAYRIRLECLGPRQLDVVVSMGDLARLLYAKHEFDEAGELLEEAVAAWSSASTLPRAELGTFLSSLGAVRRAQGRLDEAERLQREALDLFRSLGGEGGLDVALSLNNLAGVLGALGRHDEAQALLEEALRIRREQLEPHHPLVAQSLDNLALSLAYRNDLDAAEPLYLESLALELESLGADHPDVAVTRYNLAHLYARRRDLAAAESQLRLCLEIREKALEPTDARRVITKLDLAELLCAEACCEEGTVLMEAALAATRDLDPQSELRGVVLSRSAAFFEHIGQNERAARLREGRTSPPGGTGQAPDARLPSK